MKLLFLSSKIKCTSLSKVSIYWTFKGDGRRYFTVQTLANAMFFLIKKCFCAISNLAFKQDIGIQIGINPAKFWVSFFLYFF